MNSKETLSDRIMKTYRMESLGFSSEEGFNVLNISDVKDFIIDLRKAFREGIICCDHCFEFADKSIKILAGDNLL